MYYEELTKLEIAERQLIHAVELYLEGTHLTSAITLAGAAEEILGKLVNRLEKKNALELKVKRLCEMYEHVFNESAEPKSFVELRNLARDELKHIRTGNSLSIDLEEEAVKLIDRAITNYKKLKSGPVPLFWRFKKERVHRRRERMNDRESCPSNGHDTPQ